MKTKTRGEVWEWVTIFLAIFALWPWILGFRHPVWKWALYLALALMVIVAVRRLRRIRGLRRGD